jgi:hypothetical protein
MVGDFSPRRLTSARALIFEQRLFLLNLEASRIVDIWLTFLSLPDSRAQHLRTFVHIFLYFYGASLQPIDGLGYRVSGICAIMRVSPIIIIHIKIMTT